MTLLHEIFEKVVPQQWNLELIYGDYLLVTSPGRWMVTVDFDKRGFRAGHSVSARMTSTKKYEGRGWREKLVGDAVAWLQELEKA